MVIIIDGYNLLKHLFPKEKGKLDKQRSQLIRELGFYKAKKSEGIREIVLVFDGGEFGHASREIKSGITVIFSGRKESADDWIVRFVERNKGKEMMLISRDKELVSRCHRHDVEAVNVADFYDIVQNTILDEVGRDLSSQQESVKKYDRNGDISSEALDIMMEQAPLDMYNKDDLPLDEQKHKKKKGRSRKPSREERKRIAKIKKL